jgi:hypothetical protein
MKKIIGRFTRGAALACAAAALVGAVTGCEGELREQTLSVLNTEADRWDGGQPFATTAKDAYGHSLTSHVEKGMLSYVLEIRSHGPDGLPQNSDDIVVTRSKRHGETSIVEVAERATEALSSGAAKGIIKGAKEGLGIGSRGKKKE